MSTATDMRDAYLAAEKAILLGQSYKFGERMLTMADLAMVQKERANWERRAQAEVTAAAGASAPRYSQANFNDNDTQRMPSGWCR